MEGDLDIFGLALFLFFVCFLLPFLCCLGMAWLTRSRELKHWNRSTQRLLDESARKRKPTTSFEDVMQTYNDAVNREIGRHGS
jgi:hypothetical protein